MRFSNTKFGYSAIIIMGAALIMLPIIRSYRKAHILIKYLVLNPTVTVVVYVFTKLNAGTICIFIACTIMAIIDPRRMREGYGSLCVCVSVGCLSVTTLAASYSFIR